MKRLPALLAMTACALLLTSCGSSDMPANSTSGANNADQSSRVNENQENANIARSNEASNTATPKSTSSALDVFQQRILPIFHAKRPSSCSECHLSGVDLKDYIRADQEQTFAALVAAGLVDVDRPDESKILTFISRKPEKPSLITDEIRQQEFEAFRVWIRAAVNEPDLLAATPQEAIGASVPVEVIRHARKDRVLASFIDNIWSEVARCSSCHSPDQNQKQVKEHGEQVSWIKLGDPQATLEYMIEADLIDTGAPDQSLLLLKPTLQVDHGGGQKMIVGDRSYRQFRRFIDDYVATIEGKYRAADELPKQDNEVSVATSMTDGIWLKLEGVPARYDQKLLQVDIYRREGSDWSKQRWATADRAVAGNQQLWQQTLSLMAPRGSQRAEEIRRRTALPAGEYLVKVYVDDKGRLSKDTQAGLGQDDFIGDITINTQWRKGYGKMTVARFPQQ